MNAPRSSLLACVMRAFTPAMLLVVTAIVLLVVSTVELGRVTRRAAAINEQVASVKASVVAETALLQCNQSTQWPREVHVAGVHAELDCEEQQFLITLRMPAGETAVTARRLRGGASPAFSQPRAAVDLATVAKIDGGTQISSANWPELDPAQVAVAMRVDEFSGFRRDSGIALRHLAVGTDRPDYVWSDQEEDTHLAAGGLFVVPGNLWLEGSSQPLQLRLHGDVVIVVQGNLHLLRSLRVSGPGRAFLVADTMAAPVVFADCDGSGGWSAGDQLRLGSRFSGPAEGSANVYLGLPGLGAEVSCDAGIMVGGELHLATRAVVRGPLLLRHGITMLENPAVTPDQVSLLGGGPDQWVFRLGREWLPGFVVTGGSRPGRLQFRLR